MSEQSVRALNRRWIEQADADDLRAVAYWLNAVSPFTFADAIDDSDTDEEWDA